MVANPSARSGAAGAWLLCLLATAALTVSVGAALSIALPQPARRSLVGAFAAGETLFAAGLVLIVVGIGIQMWRLPEHPTTPRHALLRLVDAVAGSGLALLGLAVNAAGAGFHPVVVLLAGRPGRDTSLLLADLVAVLLVYAPLALLVLGRRRAARSARLAA